MILIPLIFIFLLKLKLFVKLLRKISKKKRITANISETVTFFLTNKNYSYFL